MFIYFYTYSIGKIGIGETAGVIRNVYFERDKLPEVYKLFETELLKESSIQLAEYLSGERKEFDLPLSPSGTTFMKEVWAELCKISYGKTASYKEVAQNIGSPKAARAVGLANNRNPIPIFIPCHRVIGANGALTGYRGGIEMKKILLELEGIK